MQTAHDWNHGTLLALGGFSAMASWPNAEKPSINCINLIAMNANKMIRKIGPRG